MKTIFAFLFIGVLASESAFAQLPVNSAECGVYNAPFSPDHDILDSVHARPNEFPWQVQIEDIFGERVCSAIILDPTWLLAAASCVQQFPVHYIVPYAILERAYYRPIDKTPYRRTVIIDKIFTHPSYDETSYEHDFSLIKLLEPLNLREWSLQPACLPYKGDCESFCAPGMKAYYVGWGRRTLTLQKAPVSILENGHCDSALSSLGDGTLFRGPTQICSGGCLDMCWFASGSSLSTFDNETHQFFLCGIGSYMVNHPLCTALGPYNADTPCAAPTTTPRPTTTTTTARRTTSGATGATGPTGPQKPLGYNPSLREEGPPGVLAPRKLGRQQISDTILSPSTDSQSPTGIFSYICPSLDWIESRSQLH